MSGWKVFHFDVVLRDSLIAPNIPGPEACFLYPTAGTLMPSKFGSKSSKGKTCLGNGLPCIEPFAVLADPDIAWPGSSH